MVRNFTSSPKQYVPSFRDSRGVLSLNLSLVKSGGMKLMSCYATIHHRECVVISSWIAFINRKYGRIRGLSRFFIMTYQSHNNRNDRLTQTQEGTGLHHEYNYVNSRPIAYSIARYNVIRSSNKQLLLWKIPHASNQGLPLLTYVRNCIH